MQTSKAVAAVNKDEGAPILKLVAFGVAGDLHTVLPAATEEITKRKGIDALSPSWRANNLKEINHCEPSRLPALWP